MKKLVLLGLCMLTFTIVKAQLIDSAKVSIRNKAYVSDSIQKISYNFYKNNPFYISKIANNFNMINMVASFDKGNFIPAQGSTQTTNLAFNTEGKTTLGKVNLFGAFNFQKITEDSTRWAHQTRNTPNAPLYFGSIKYNHYERTIYNFKAVAERNILKNNLPISFGIDYRIGNHFSNNDPRGDLSDYQLNTTTTIAYQLNKLKTGASFIYGYGREDINIGYSNDNVKTLPYITWRNAGYGISEEYSSLKYTDLQQRYGADLNFDFDINHHQNLMLKLSYLKENSNYVRMASGQSSTTTSVALLDYALDNISAMIFYKFKTKKTNYLVELSYTDQAGADLYYPNSFKSTAMPDEIIYKYNNYLYDLQQVNFKITQSKNSTYRSIFNSFLGTNYIKETKKDGSSGNTVSYDRLNVSTGFSYTKTKNEQIFGLGLSGLLSMNLAETFIVPQVNEKIFYKYVIYHDYLYQTAKYASIGFNADYSFPAYQILQASIKLDVNYLSKIGNFNNLEREILSTPGKDRLFSTLSLNLFF